MNCGGLSCTSKMSTCILVVTLCTPSCSCNRTTKLVSISTGSFNCVSYFLNRFTCLLCMSVTLLCTIFYVYIYILLSEINLYINISNHDVYISMMNILNISGKITQSKLFGKKKARVSFKYTQWWNHWINLPSKTKAIYSYPNAINTNRMLDFHHWRIPTFTKA